MSGLISLLNGDLENYHSIAEDFDENLSISPEFIKLCICVFTYSKGNKNSTWPKNYDPEYKWKLLKRSVPWLCKTLNISSRIGAMAIIRLVQGDLSVLGHIYDKLGWTGIMRSYYASIAALASPVAFNEVLESDIQYGWMAFKHLTSIVTNLSNLLQL